MKFNLPAAGMLAALVAPALAQNVQVSAVAVQPNAPNRVWVCNKDNGTVACIDVNAPGLVAEIPVGVHPRSLAFSQDGSRLFVANQRGNVPIDRNFVTPFNGTEMRGTVSVIESATYRVIETFTVGAGSRYMNTTLSAVSAMRPMVMPSDHSLICVAAMAKARTEATRAAMM